MLSERQTLLDQRIAAEPSQLTEIRQRIDQLATTQGLTTAAAADVALAVSEAVANIIEHGYRGSPGHFIRLEVAHEPGRLIIVIDDDAPAIDPAKIRPRPLDDLRPGGLGVHFIKALMNEVTYQARAGGGNRLTMAREL